jgi:hypothetical protein
MKSVIKSLNRTKKKLYFVFKLDKNVLKNIERIFRKLRKGFKLSNYRKYRGEKWLDDFYESTGKGKNFNFMIVVKGNTVRLKLQANPMLITRFLRISEKYTKFARMLPKVKAKFERRKLKRKTSGNQARQ